MRRHNRIAHTVSIVRLLGCEVCVGRSDQSAYPTSPELAQPPSVSLFSAATQGEAVRPRGPMRSPQPAVCQPHAANARAERRDAKQQATEDVKRPGQRPERWEDSKADRSEEH